MGDISPGHTTVDSFNKKQQQFREQLVAQQKEREARAFARQNTAASSEPAQTAVKETNEQTGQTADAKSPEPDRKSGPLTNLIYGTKEGREMDAQIEASFSQVLARGKYVHSIVFHQVKPDKVDEYVKLVGEWYPKMANLPENKVHLVGSWRTEVGDCDTFGMYAHWNILHNALLTTNRSPYLGIPKIRRLPRVSSQHHPPPRVRRFRPQAGNSHPVQADLTDAGILILADNTPSPARRCL